MVTILQWSLVGVISAQVLVFWYLFRVMNRAYKVYLESDRNVRELLLSLQDHFLSVKASTHPEAELKRVADHFKQLDGVFNKEKNTP